MIQSLQWWKVIATLASLSVLVVTGMDSINMVFEKFEGIDISFMGTPNLTQYDAKVDFTATERENGECMYRFNIDFDPGRRETPPGDDDFSGSCAINGGNATDGLPWHANRRHWVRFPDHVITATGLDHLSMEWIPCGREPAGFRQARWDLNFYTVIPEYRAFMICDTFKSPPVCQYNQSSYLGRRMFTLPRLAQDPTYLANLPLNYAPDPKFPEAREYEGLIHYDPELLPETNANWTLPGFLMTTYDAAVVSWRAMIPHSFFIDKAWVNSSEYQYYNYQTMRGLPSNWSTYYEGSRMSVDVEGPVLENSRGLCRNSLNPIQGDQNEEIIFEDPGKIQPNDMIN